MTGKEKDGELRAVRARVTGRVQGVCYRAWTEDNAKGLGLSGWVRNRRDGSVEALFAGPVRAIDEMLRYCRHGPPAAAVADVVVVEETGELPSRFTILPTV